MRKEEELKVIVTNPPTKEQEIQIVKRIERYLNNMRMSECEEIITDKKGNIKN